MPYLAQTLLPWSVFESFLCFTGQVAERSKSAALDELSLVQQKLDEMQVGGAIA